MKSDKPLKTSKCFIPLYPFNNVIRDASRVGSIEEISWNYLIREYPPQEKDWVIMGYFDSIEEAQDYIIDVLREKIKITKNLFQKAKDKHYKVIKILEKLLITK